MVNWTRQETNISWEDVDLVTPYNDCINSFIFKNDDGEVFYLEDNIIAWLLLSDTCFVNSRKYVSLRGEVEDETIVVFMNCSDTFDLGGSDAEALTTKDAIDLFKEIDKDKDWGSTIWVCKKRGDEASCSRH